MRVAADPPTLDGADSLLKWALGIVSAIFGTGFIFALSRATRVERESRERDDKIANDLQKAIIDGRSARDLQRQEWSRHITDVQKETAVAIQGVWKELNALNRQIALNLVATEQRFATKEDISKLERGQKETQEQIRSDVEMLYERFVESVGLMIENRKPIRNGD